MPLPDLICFSHLRWDFVWQRPQHLMTRAAVERRVWFVEEPQEGGTEPVLEMRPVAPRVSVVVPRLPAGLSRDERVDAQSRLLSQLAGAMETPPLHWYYSPMFREVTSALPSSGVVYDCMDELSAFAGAPPALRRWESELLAAADVVFTGGVSLYQSKRQRHSRVFPFPSSVDVDHFRTARAGLPEPDAHAGVGRPRIGFAGVIDERFDVPLVAELARLRPGYAFVMVGPVVKISADVLPRAENLHYVGMQPYGELPRFFANWDVACLPFARNDATRFISPTKTPEYLAAGRPVVSTSITDVVKTYGEEGLVQIADEPDAFAAALDRALADQPRGWLDTVDRHLARMSWDRTWRQMHAYVLESEVRRFYKADPHATIVAEAADRAPRRGTQRP
jgi:glycosyltransferase involved in cell wall biosynthesis